MLWQSELAQWGSTPAERAQRFPCDHLLGAPDQALFRAVPVEAPAAVTFRWLCQLRVAPYSYDWIDNLGRRSPRELTPGVERLAPGQRVMTIFTLVEFEDGVSITVSTAGRSFGRIICTYRVEAFGERSRIVVKLLGAYRAPQRILIRALLPVGDLVMMRRQLLNLKALAEQSHRGGIAAVR
ncbi:MAG: hypothetical protein ACLP01_00120 [Solirubrobacteraceae bacterium]